MYFGVWQGTSRRSSTGAKPGDLAVEKPTKFELIINMKTANMKTAKALGLTIRSPCCCGPTRSSSSALTIPALREPCDEHRELIRYSGASTERIFVMKPAGSATNRPVSGL